MRFTVEAIALRLRTFHQCFSLMTVVFLHVLDDSEKCAVADAVRSGINEGSRIQEARSKHQSCRSICVVSYAWAFSLLAPATTEGRLQQALSISNHPGTLPWYQQPPLLLILYCFY